MKSVYESIMTGLNEAIEDAQSEGKKLNRRTVTIIPVNMERSRLEILEIL